MMSLQAFVTANDARIRPARRAPRLPATKLYFTTKVLAACSRNELRRLMPRWRCRRDVAECLYDVTVIWFQDCHLILPKVMPPLPPRRLLFWYHNFNDLLLRRELLLLAEIMLHYWWPRYRSPYITGGVDADGDAICLLVKREHIHWHRNTSENSFYSYHVVTSSKYNMTLPGDIEPMMMMMMPLGWFELIGIIRDYTMAPLNTKISKRTE